MCPWVHVTEREGFRERTLDSRGKKEAGKGLRTNIGPKYQDIRQAQDMAQRTGVWSPLNNLIIIDKTEGYEIVLLGLQVFQTLLLRLKIKSSRVETIYLCVCILEALFCTTLLIQL